jgi:hypothetical protein
MAEAWIDVSALKPRLASFFGSDRHDLLLFGSTVNQVFEAFVFAQLRQFTMPQWRLDLDCYARQATAKQSAPSHQLAARVLASLRPDPTNPTMDLFQPPP